MSTPEDNTFRPIPNPYIVGNPIEDPRMFFGREDDFDYLRKKVTGGEKGGMIVLCGSRRSGKTSILFQIRGGRLGEGFLPVLVDMQSMTVQSDAEFLEKLLREIGASLGRAGIPVEMDPEVGSRGNPLFAFQEQAIRVSDALDGRKLILLFDEYELFESYVEKERFSVDVLNVLANWMEYKEGVFIVFTGSDKLEERDPRYWDHFLGKAVHRRISFLSRSDALRLVHEPVRDLVSYEEGVPEEIYHLTAGQPFYTQVLCQNLVDHLNESGKNRATLEDVQEVVAQIIDNPLPQMIFAWSSLSDLEKLSLSIIAERSKEAEGPVHPDEVHEYAAREKIGFRFDPGKLRETAERLFYQDLLDKEAEGEGFIFKMDLWRRWVVRMHSIWQVIDEIRSEEREPEEGIFPVRSRLRRALVFAAPAAAAVLLIAVYALFIQEKTAPARMAAAPVDSTSISVETEPAGARVFLDNLLVGTSPVRATVPAKRSHLMVAHAGYRDFNDTLDLVKDEPAERRISLEEIVGDLRITSEPAGAAIAMDGEATGLATPAVIAALSSNTPHKVRLTLSGFNDASYQGVEVFGDSMALLHHDFARITHPLTVLSEPPGADAYLDGRHLGETPQSLTAVDEGPHELELRLYGYETLRRTVEAPAPNNQIALVLAKLPPGEVTFEIHPYAELWIDGEMKEKDAVHFQTKLDPGVHVIELRHPHYGTTTDRIEVKSEEKITKQYHLDKRGEG
ncbi:MAG: PEGA domain-containing protein [Candidatus Eisenbacteria bacterium]